jgi:hypothetical protein
MSDKLVEHLRHHVQDEGGFCTDLDAEVRTIANERDALRAEVERLKRGRHTLNVASTSPDLAHTITVQCGLAAEVERLNQALDMVAEERESWKACAQRERAEAEQLRAIARVHLETGRMLAAENDELRAEAERASMVRVLDLLLAVVAELNAQERKEQEREQREGRIKHPYVSGRKAS